TSQSVVPCSLPIPFCGIKFHLLKTLPHGISDHNKKAIGMPDIWIAFDAYAASRRGREKRGDDDEIASVRSRNIDAMKQATPRRSSRVDGAPRTTSRRRLRATSRRCTTCGDETATVSAHNCLDPLEAAAAAVPRLVPRRVLG